MDACPLPLDPALAEVIFEWRRKSEFSADSDFVFAAPYVAGEKPYTPWNLQHNHLSPAAVTAGLGPIGWHKLRHTYPHGFLLHGKRLAVISQPRPCPSTFAARLLLVAWMM
jgi:hypothetical protein